MPAGNAVATQDSTTNTAAQREERKKNLTVPLTLELIGIDIEKGGIYRLQLGFQPGATPLPAFEQSLRTDYGGEIEVFLDDKLHKRLRYEDHAGFAPTPVGDGYGPVYYVRIDVDFFGGSRQCDLYPKIRAKKPCSYALSLSREHYSLMEKIGNLFRPPIASHTTAPETPAQPRPELEAQALVERIDILTEKKGNHFFTIAFHKPTSQIINDIDRVRDEDNFYKKLRNEITGDIEVYKNDKQYMAFDYNSSRSRSWIGNMYHIMGFSYFLEDIDVEWYSFKPKIMSSEKRAFAFGFERSYTTM